MWTGSHLQAQPSYSSCLGQDKQTVLSVMFAHQLPCCGLTENLPGQSQAETPIPKGEGLGISVLECISFETKQQQSCRQNIFLHTFQVLTVVYSKRNGNKIMLPAVWFSLGERQRDWAIIPHTPGTGDICLEVFYFQGQLLQVQRLSGEISQAHCCLFLSDLPHLFISSRICYFPKNRNKWLGTPSSGLQNPAGNKFYGFVQRTRGPYWSWKHQHQQRSSSNDGDTTSGHPSFSEVFSFVLVWYSNRKLVQKIQIRLPSQDVKDGKRILKLLVSYWNYNVSTK